MEPQGGRQRGRHRSTRDTLFNKRRRNLARWLGLIASAKETIKEVGVLDNYFTVVADSASQVAAAVAAQAQQR